MTKSGDISDLGTEYITLKARQAMLQWYGHIMRMSRGDNADGSKRTRAKGRPRMRWMDNIRHEASAV